jgi:hypothetical protein
MVVVLMFNLLIAGITYFGGSALGFAKPVLTQLNAYNTTIQSRTHVITGMFNGSTIIEPLSYYNVSSGGWGFLGWGLGSVYNGFAWLINTIAWFVMLVINVISLIVIGILMVLFLVFVFIPTLLLQIGVIGQIIGYVYDAVNIVLIVYAIMLIRGWLRDVRGGGTTVETHVHGR